MSTTINLLLVTTETASNLWLFQTILQETSLYIYLSWLISETLMPITIKGLLIQNFLSTLHQKGIEDRICCCHCFCSSFSYHPLFSYSLIICFTKNYEHMGFGQVRQVLLCSGCPTAGWDSSMLVSIWNEPFSVNPLCSLRRTDCHKLILPTVSSTSRISPSFKEPSFC